MFSASTTIDTLIRSGRIFGKYAVEEDIKTQTSTEIRMLLLVQFNVFYSFVATCIYRSDNVPHQLTQLSKMFTLDSHPNPLS